MSDWKLASSAPRDGTNILVCYGSERVINSVGVEIEINSDSHAITNCNSLGWYNGEWHEPEDDDGPPFQFWMPLPAVPKSST